MADSFQAVMGCCLSLLIPMRSAALDRDVHHGDHARRMAKVCDGLACIIEADSLRQGGRAGSFQSGESIFGLLCSLGAAFDSIGCKVDLGDSARAELLARIEATRRNQVARP